MNPRTQGRTFGEVAAVYDRQRPGYPPDAIDHLAGRGARGDVLELGSGTGKLTVLLAPLAARVVAVEPDAEMVAVARTHLGGLGHVTFTVDSFEASQPAEAAFDLVVCAQAWHWLDPSTRTRRAAQALRPGGWLALLWNRPAIDDASLQADLDRAYERHAPQIAARAVGAAPTSESRSTVDDELSACPLLGAPDTAEFEHTVRYTSEEHRALLGTMSDLLMMPPARRSALIGAISDAIDARGGVVDVRYNCRVVTARRLPQ